MKINLRYSPYIPLIDFPNSKNTYRICLSSWLLVGAGFYSPYARADADPMSSFGDLLNNSAPTPKVPKMTPNLVRARVTPDRSPIEPHFTHTIPPPRHPVPSPRTPRITTSPTQPHNPPSDPL